METDFLVTRLLSDIKEIFPGTYKFERSETSEKEDLKLKTGQNHRLKLPSSRKATEFPLNAVKRKSSALRACAAAGFSRFGAGIETNDRTAHEQDAEPESSRPRPGKKHMPLSLAFPVSS